ncbi:TATA box-binding protein-associated factor RNA polymerase I subunit A [Chanos chanos]|uniref:TATA box-binding protein-associated factor RNA polymerase I subunit A n=1 Tax=Chanos chanos TaxID=29144 RepID=A0A6J2V3G8_CHACN|nr:TATA box-binding protein-associated factor RNA polymerase I subunit A [Chanos chanos]
MDDIEAELNLPERDDSDSSDDEMNIKIHRGRKRLPLPSPFQETPKETGFQTSMRLCLNALREALLHHRWHEAAEYFSAYCQSLEHTSCTKRILAPEIVWRFGIEVLHHHPDSKHEDVICLYERMKNFGVKNYTKICLEQAFHLLLNGHFDEAKRHLSVAESWRYGKESLKQSLEMKLIHAYSGFLHYLSWCSKKQAFSDDDDAGTNHKMHGYFRQASVTLQETIKQPGVWDPFVLSYVNMLEYYNDLDGALSVLKDYAYDKDFPANPNAQVYLYQFLKRHKAPVDKLVKTLKVLHSLVPSHELMLEYCSLLLKSGDIQEALRVVMDLLEYSSWKRNLNAWKYLYHTLNTLKKRNQRQVGFTAWEERKDLWFNLHFRTYHARKDHLQSEELWLVKAAVLRKMGARTLHYCRCSSKDLNMT